MAKKLKEDSKDSEDEDDTLYEGKDTSSSDSREKVTMDEIFTGEYIDFGVGKAVELEIDEIEKVKDEEYHFSNLDYKIEIIDADGDRLSVTAHKLWGMIKQAIRNASDSLGIESPEGLKLKLRHNNGRGNYEVYWYNPNLEGFEEVQDRSKQKS